MKRLSIAVAAVTALALTAGPAFADDNKNGNDHKNKPAKVVTYEIGGTIATLAAPNLTVKVKNVSMGDEGRQVAKAILGAASLTVSTDTNTVINRGTAKTFASLMVGDRVQLRATCTLTPLSCKALRINASPAPVVQPPALHLNFDVTGVVIANTGTALTLVVTRAGTGDDLTLKAKSLLGTQFNVLTDTTTVVTKAGAAVTIASLTGFPAVNMAGTCTQATPAVCTAKRITVIVPTA